MACKFVGYYSSCWAQIIRKRPSAATESPKPKALDCTVKKLLPAMRVNRLRAASTIPVCRLLTSEPMPYPMKLGSP